MESIINVKLMKTRVDAIIPVRTTPGSAGYDLHACFDDSYQDSVMIRERPVMFGSGIAIELPEGFEAQIRPRSSLSKEGCILPQGTIDSDYRGEIMLVLFMCYPGGEYRIYRGDRVAQMTISRIPDVNFCVVPSLSQTMRGAGGFGSTGRR